MNIPIYCERCGGLIGTYDTNEDVSVDWAEAPCGEKICSDCCRYCYEVNGCIDMQEDENATD